MLTSEEILVTAEDVIRRYGPSKATVVDVARALGVSHGSVYRHFPSKAALRDAVTERWLERVAAPLEKVAYSTRLAPPKRLRRFFDALIRAKRMRALEDPEMFSNYMSLIDETDGAVSDHVEHLVSLIKHIVDEGVASGEFVVAKDSRTTARGLLNATSVFHNPAHAPEWTRPTIDDEFEAVWQIVMAGLEKR